MAKNDTAQKKSGFLLREVIDSTSIGLVVVDLYHKILDYNHCFRKFVDSSFCDPTGSLFGLDFYQVIGEPFFSMVILPRFISQQQKIAQRQPWLAS